jgi:hypothetical protein
MLSNRRVAIEAATTIVGTIIGIEFTDRTPQKGLVNLSVNGPRPKSKKFLMLLIDVMHMLPDLPGIARGESTQ